MLKNPRLRTVVTHWGTYSHVDGDADLQPLAADPSPSSLASSMTDPFTIAPASDGRRSDPPS